MVLRTDFDALDVLIEMLFAKKDGSNPDDVVFAVLVVVLTICGWETEVDEGGVGSVTGSSSTRELRTSISKSLRLLMTLLPSFPSGGAFPAACVGSWNMCRKLFGVELKESR